jgi:hypothetical protein
MVSKFVYGIPIPIKGLNTVNFYLLLTLGIPLVRELQYFPEENPILSETYSHVENGTRLEMGNLFDNDRYGLSKAQRHRFPSPLCLVLFQTLR